ncbi:hypothetical protein LR48_Vigan2382s000100 [Vigna angularis]|uniref:SHSP domain-containing protein n=2 Tax=Phaseolus angularis TaxID=3914 RepID=A0A0S3QZB3_PHAAN|nr:class I heat shock protein [Vigna angularis]KAG2410199.1 class I heat shock protein [Vigna angularis]KOM24640.1 hypothetical protein LR48_Vigan2382s000100 [Vigna angularis]BAT73692.1 hypothetical protein VIGAN_01120600 [Vigna angularis var. angularis]BAT73695.1 hypothetical protein VIGAN_01120900 [Vigna angularis var. angularis]
MSLIPSIIGRRSNVFDPFSMDVWDPFKDFPFQNSLSASFPEFSRQNSAFVSTRVDWKETPEAHVFKAEIPGLKKEEVKVEVEDDKVLQISGERNVEKEDKNDTWHRVERSSGKFLRRFLLSLFLRKRLRNLRSSPLKFLVKQCYFVDDRVFFVLLKNLCVSDTIKVL